MIITTPKQLAVAMRNARLEQKKTQSQTASLVGIKQATISAFENHPEGTQIETLFKMLAALELQITLSPRNELPPNAQGWTEEW